MANPAAKGATTAKTATVENFMVGRQVDWTKWVNKSSSSSSVTTQPCASENGLGSYYVRFGTPRIERGFPKSSVSDEKDDDGKYTSPRSRSCLIDGFLRHGYEKPNQLPETTQILSLNTYLHPVWTYPEPQVSRKVVLDPTVAITHRGIRDTTATYV